LGKEQGKASRRKALKEVVLNLKSKRGRGFRKTCLLRGSYTD